MVNWKDTPSDNILLPITREPIRKSIERHPNSYLGFFSSVWREVLTNELLTKEPLERCGGWVKCSAVDQPQAIAISRPHCDGPKDMIINFNIYLP